jgi:transaldolase
MINAKTAWILSKKKMYERSDGHVHVLAASIRSINHLLCSLFLAAELATVPSKVLQEWAAAGFPMPDPEFNYKGVDEKGNPLKPLSYKELDLNRSWESFDLAHELTTKGIQKFVADYRAHWNAQPSGLPRGSKPSLFATTN